MNITTGKMEASNNKLIQPASLVVLKHCWFASGVSGTTITDGKAGTAITDLSISDNADGTFEADTASVEVNLANLVDADINDILLVMAGQNSSVSSIMRVKIGNTSSSLNAQSRAAATVSGVLITETPTTFSTGVLSTNTDATDYTLICAADRDGNIDASRYAVDAVDSAGTSTAISGESAVGVNFGLDNEVAIKGSNIAGIGLFVFSAGLPANWKEVSLHMAGMWRAGYEYLPAEWAHLT